MTESPAEPPPEPSVAEPSVAEPSAEQLVDELRKVKVSDLLVHTCSMLASLAFGKLAVDARDLEQARLAIDALTALGPLLDEGPKRDIQQVVANLQLAYAETAAPSGDAGSSASPPGV